MTSEDSVIGRPAVQEWMRAPIKGYRSVYESEFCPQETRIFGTESLYCNWNGRLLILAQDFSHDECIRERLRAGEQRPYRHDPCNRTNIQLRKLVEDSGLDGDVLYGSAMGGMLKIGDGLGSKLPNLKGARAYASRLLEFVVEAMPNICAIACLGTFAWEVACNRIAGLSSISAATKCRRGYLESRKPIHVVIDDREIGLFAHVHTSNRGVNSRLRGTDNGRARIDAIEKDWNAMADWVRDQEPSI